MQPRATGNKHQVRHQVEHSTRVRTAEGSGVGGLVGGSMSRGGGLNRGGEQSWGSWEVVQRRNKPAGGGGRHVLYLLAQQDEVTKTILNSPKALTASRDRCYCPRQSNTTVWIRRKKKKSIEKIHKAASRSRQTHRHQGGEDLWQRFRPRGAGGK